MAVGGLAGGIRGVVAGEEVGESLAILGIDVLGVLIVIGYFVNHDR